MPILTSPGDLPEATLRTAIDALAGGLVVAVPTDTVYGLAVDPFRPGATARLFAAKRRPRGVPLPVVVGSVEQAMAMAAEAGVAPAASALMARLWPGALTIVVPRREGLIADLGDDAGTVGLRWPDHAVIEALCAEVGPLATTSANLHGEPTPLTAGGVAAVFGETVAVVLDGGPCGGAPSTVVDCTGAEPRLRREGRIPWADVVAAATATHGPGQR
ncbi:MAG: L-threonylcarbamoyladenylate synthase [Acidimicrobiales bacterium]